MKNLKISQKETRNQNSDRYKILRMIIGNTQKFWTIIMKDSKSWFFPKNWFDSAVFDNLNSPFGIVHKYNLTGETVVCLRLSFLKICIHQIFISCFSLANFGFFQFLHFQEFQAITIIPYRSPLFRKFWTFSGGICTKSRSERRLRRAF